MSTDSRRAWLWPLLLALSACGNQGTEPPAAVDQDGAQPKVTAVIVDLSNGANPYHQVFRRPGWTRHPSAVIPGFPADAPVLDLTFGPDLAADIAADRVKWETIQYGVPYWVRGTNLIYVVTRQAGTYAGIGSDRPNPYTTTDHGMGPPAVMANTCPDCYVVVVSDPGAGGDDSIDFVTEHLPWADIAESTQRSAPLSNDPADFLILLNQLALDPLLGPAGPYAQALRRFDASGRLFFTGSGDTPQSLLGPTPIMYYTFTPWAVVTGGAHGACRAAEKNSGRPAEFASEFTVPVPDADSIDGYRMGSGTSYSAPMLAAHFAAALKRVREHFGDGRQAGAYWAGAPQESSYLADGVLDKDELYDAFMRAAELFAPGEFSGGCGPDAQATSAMPWLELGWGYVGSAQTERAIELLLGTAPLPQRPAEQQQYMELYLGARQAYGLAGGIVP